MIAEQLLDNGILQFGIFDIEGQQSPYRLRLEMLPAYPTLLTTVVTDIIDNFPDKPIERLVVTADGSVLGGVIAQKTGISLVYSLGRGASPVHDLVGAYDIGHPACLIVNTLDDKLHSFIKGCQRVGLDIHTIIAIIASEKSVADIPVIALYTLEAILNELNDNQQIPEQQMNTVLDYISGQKKIAQPND